VIGKQEVNRSAAFIAYPVLNEDDWVVHRDRDPPMEPKRFTKSPPID
jgi:hypothetical protein